MAQQASQRVTIRTYQPEDFEALTRIDQGIWWTAPDRSASTAAPIPTPAAGRAGAGHTDAIGATAAASSTASASTAGTTASVTAATPVDAATPAATPAWPDLGSMLARLDMLHCLGKSTDALVATDASGQPLGAMLMRVDGHAEPWRRECDATAASIRGTIATRAEGPALLRALDTDGDAIDALSERSAAGYPAEVVLFMLGPASRGLGLGRRLFDAGLDLMHGAGAGRYFLYTDTTCTYTFYEHRGLRRIGEAIGQRDMFGDPIDRFIYADSLVRTDDSARAGAVVQTDTPAQASVPAQQAEGAR